MATTEPVAGSDASGTLSALLHEERRYPPSDEFKKNALWNDPAIYERAEQDPEAFWAEQAQAIDWFKPWDKILEWNAPIAKWFVGAQVNASYNCVDRHLDSWRRNKAAIVFEGEPGDQRVLTYRDLYRDVNKCAAALKRLGVQQRRPRPDLPGHGARATDRDARLRAHRRTPHGRLRRVQRRLHRRPRERLPGQLRHHRRWRLAARQQDSAQGHDGPCPGAVPDGQERPGRESHRRPEDGRDEVGPRYLVAPCPGRIGRRNRRARKSWTPSTRSTSCTPRAPRANPRACCTPRAATWLAPRARTSTSSTSRKRTSSGALPISAGSLATRTSSTARSPMAPPASCTKARPTSRQGPLLGHRREVRGHHPVHRADRDPDLHEVGQGVPGQARPEQPARAGQCRRADQSRSLGLVPRGHRHGPLPRRRYLVDDRDGPDSDNAPAGHHRHQAWLGDVPVPRRQGRRARRTAATACRSARVATWSSSVRGRPWRAPSGATPSATRSSTGAASRAATSRATAPSATRRATTGCSGASTTC